MPFLSDARINPSMSHKCFLKVDSENMSGPENFVSGSQSQRPFSC
jgi:hypothetical protein